MVDPILSFALGAVLMALITWLDRWLYDNESRRLSRETMQAAREWSDAAKAEMTAAKGLYAAAKSYHEATEAEVKHAHMILSQYKDRTNDCSS